MTEGITCQVYVLQNPDGKFYIGLSENVNVRLQHHNQAFRSGRGIEVLGLWFGQANS